MTDEKQIEAKESEDVKGCNVRTNSEEDPKIVHSLLRLASDKYQDDEGYVNVSAAGQFIN